MNQSKINKIKVIHQEIKPPQKTSKLQYLIKKNIIIVFNILAANTSKLKYLVIGFVLGVFTILVAIEIYFQL